VVAPVQCDLTQRKSICKRSNKQLVPTKVLETPVALKPTSKTSSLLCNHDSKKQKATISWWQLMVVASNSK